jgi:hypothetical protein
LFAGIWGKVNSSNDGVDLLSLTISSLLIMPFSFLILRDVITGLIGKARTEGGFSSNQEFVPSIGRTVWPRVYPDPLHASINAWRRWLLSILKTIADLEQRRPQDLKKQSTAPSLKEDQGNTPLIIFIKVSLDYVCLNSLIRF